MVLDITIDWEDSFFLFLNDIQKYIPEVMIIKNKTLKHCKKMWSNIYTLVAEKAFLRSV